MREKESESDREREREREEKRQREGIIKRENYREWESDRGGGETERRKGTKIESEHQSSTKCGRNHQRRLKYCLGTHVTSFIQTHHQHA